MQDTFAFFWEKSYFSWKVEENSTFLQDNSVFLQKKSGFLQENSASLEENVTFLQKNSDFLQENSVLLEWLGVPSCISELKASLPWGLFENFLLFLWGLWESLREEELQVRRGPCEQHPACLSTRLSPVELLSCSTTSRGDSSRVYQTAAVNAVWRWWRPKENQVKIYGPFRVFWSSPGDVFRCNVMQIAGMWDIGLANGPFILNKIFHLKIRVIFFYKFL